MATLYAAYHLAEKLGVRFYLHGDVLPDKRVTFEIPDLDETHQPLFQLRGLDPWGSHAGGFDLWNTDDWKAHLSQLAKMRMDFIGIHCHVGEQEIQGLTWRSEPTVWVGLPDEFQASGKVTFAYPSSLFNTLRESWGFQAKPTGDYSNGASLLFDRDEWGADVMRGHAPYPSTQEGQKEVVDRMGQMLREAFSFARPLGVKSCVGTESPLNLPPELGEHLAAREMKPDDPATRQRLYEGIFGRIKQTHPLDYYWLWTEEDWTWEGNSPEAAQAVLDEMSIAMKALKEVGAPFELATAGWVLGPADDRTAWDKALPKNVPFSAISRDTGKEPLDRSFAQIEGRGKWAIPWLEDDPALASPQLWVARTRQDAADALAYGCNGLIGLLWRTHTISPQIRALALAGWEQPWNPDANRSASDKSPPVGMLTHRLTITGDPTEFYTDWANHSFGNEVAESVAAVFGRIDGQLPVTTTWGPGATGPGAGGFRPIAGPIEKVEEQFAFVSELEAIRADVQGAGNLARFDYWLNLFRYHRAQGRAAARWDEFEKSWRQVAPARSAQAKSQLAMQYALPVYAELTKAMSEMINSQMAAADTLGDLGTLINWQGKNIPYMHSRTESLLRDILAPALINDVKMPDTYTGAPRLIVPTVRSRVVVGEALTIKVIILDRSSPASAALHWRSMGEGGFQQIALSHVARGVYTVTLPPASVGAIEYYIAAELADEASLVWPATAPGLNQTVVVTP